MSQQAVSADIFPNSAVWCGLPPQGLPEYSWGVHEISYPRNFVHFVCFFKFRILFESGNNFKKIIENSLLQGCAYRFRTNISIQHRQNYNFFLRYQCQCSEGLPWRRGGLLWFLFTSVFSNVLFGISFGQVMKELYGSIFNKPAV